MYSPDVWFDLLKESKEPVYFLGREVMFKDLTPIEQKALTIYLSDQSQQLHLILNALMRQEKGSQ